MSQFIKLLRNTALFGNHDAALEALNTKLGQLSDGEVALATYGEDGSAKTLLGIKRTAGNTIIDLEAISGDITTAIQGLDATVGDTTVGEGKHVAVQVVETDGKLTQLTVNESDIASATLLGNIDDAATANTAFGKIAAEAAARAKAIEDLDNTDTETAGSVVVAVSTEDGIAKPTKQAMSVVKVADTEKATNMAAEYQIKIGDHALETKISIPYAESVLTNAVLAKMDSEVNASTGIVTTPEGSTAHDALVMVFLKADGTYVGVKVDVATILVESEFKDGLKVNGGEVSIELGDTNDYLKFGTAAEGKNAPLEVNVVTMADAAEGNTGVADALDVKTVIEENEKVTAAALNDINTRIGENDDLETEADVIVDAINELKTAIDSVTGDALVEVEGSKAITVSTKAEKKQTVSLKLDTTTTSGQGENALSITDNGLYLSNVWDCGTY